MGTVDGGVLHIHVDNLAKQLLVLVPHYRVLIHRHARVKRVIHERVAHCLHVNPVCPHLVIGMNLAIHRVGVDIECEYLKRVGMHEESVLLRVVDSHRLLGCHGISLLVVIIAIVAGEHVLVDRVGINHVVERLAHTRLTVVEHTVANHRLSLVLQHRTPKEFRLFRLGVIISILGVYLTCL